MSQPSKVDVLISGVEAVTERAIWNGPDGIGWSVNGMHLCLAIHHDGETHTVWLSGVLLDHVSEQLADALHKVVQAEAAQTVTVQ